jgi:hypothetical protein
MFAVFVQSVTVFSFKIWTGWGGEGFIEYF